MPDNCPDVYFDRLPKRLGENRWRSFDNQLPSLRAILLLAHTASLVLAGRSGAVYAEIVAKRSIYLIVGANVEEFKVLIGLTVHYT